MDAGCTADGDCNGQTDCADAACGSYPTCVGGRPAAHQLYDPFFDGLRAWGDTVWNLWVHNKDVPGAAPVLMTESVW